jgi:predicted flap endonuclease-1-like 5' DNA nuclease
MCIPCILIPVLVGLICALLGYLLGRLVSNKKIVLENLHTELDECRASNIELQNKLSDLEKQAVSSNVNTFVSTLPDFDAKLAQNIYGKKVKNNDLKIIEGIGPKIEELFHSAGIHTWLNLSETSIDKCNQILKEGGDRFAIHNPSTWPKQASMAAQGLWAELKQWQDSLDGGKVK